MIHVDEEYPVEEIEPCFPYRFVTIQKDVNPADSYDILPELGRGSFGTVFLCKERSSGLELAAKIVTCKKKKDRIMVEREIEIMSGLHHSRLIQLYDAFDYQSNIYAIMELIQGGELFERVIDDDFILTERAVSTIMKEILEGIEFIHSRNIIHLDMKPENILCLTKSGNRIKIIDFGFARRYDPSKKLQVMFGTPEFSAPEVINFDEIGFYTDMWSLGVICYVLLSGLSPFVGENDIATMGNVSNGLYSFDHRSFEPVSDNAKNFISQLLIKDGGQRMTASQALGHAWLVEKANNTELSITKTKLKRYVIKKRWIKAVNTIIALRRMGAKINLNLV